MPIPSGESHGAAGKRDPLPAPVAVGNATHPFFMKVSEKKKLEQQQQAETASVQGGIQTPTPNPTTDDEQLEVSKPARGRKPKTAPKQRQVKVRKVKQLLLPPPPPPPSQEIPSSPFISLASTRTEIDPVTAAAASPWTPSSSPPVVGEAPAVVADVVEVEAEVDPNYRRSKRRKKTSPTASFMFVVDDKTGTILSSPPSTHRRNGRLIVSYNSPLLTIRVTGDMSPDQLLPKKKSCPPSSPVLPSLSLDEKIPRADADSTTPKRSTRGAQAVYDKSSCIKSSPSQLPAPRNAFTVLGKKKGVGGAVSKRANKSCAIEPSAETISIASAGTTTGSNLNIVIAAQKPTASIPKTSFADGKSVHPFFSATGRKKMVQTASSPTDSVLRSQSEGSIVTSQPSSSSGKHRGQKPSWGFTSGFGGSVDRVTKTPGMGEAPWPVQGMSHVRGLTSPDDMAGLGGSNNFLDERKLKDTGIVIQAHEGILNKLAIDLGISSLRDAISTDDYEMRKYLQVAPEVRLPVRILTTGSQLQEMMRLRISARLPHPKTMSQLQRQIDSDSDSSNEVTIAGTRVHPALLRLYRRLGTELTAFDVHECEPTPWEVKYAPQTIGEVLQPGREKDVFREWLMELRTDKVHVETGLKGKRKAKGNSRASATKKKRKKKGDEMDGFVVTSEEEQDLMDEITVPEEDDWLNATTKTKKSTIRAGDKLSDLQMFLGKIKEPCKKTNTIVISGPTGSGKTAAVYAIAKELSYAVFEVNPGIRRNGRDVLDQVGDMSKNHLVHHARSVSETDNPSSKAKSVTEGFVAFEEELEMRQKQSLILLEEVDVLFEEDKNFWNTVVSLMLKSKRPIVLTCNDESVLPWDDLSLHAILRFSMPPRDLLVDHLLLISANEGHLLQRSAVDALVKSNKDDIRASIMNLQFFCRMAVGDRKGGLDWLVDRWPAGCDIAENGERLRVVSEDTYCKGMGLVHNAPGLKEEDKWECVWEEYGLDIGASEEGIEECTKRIEEVGIEKQVSLRIADAFFEARSATDTFASLAVSRFGESKLDSTLPLRNEKTMLDDLYGYSTVHTDQHVVPGSVGTEISIYMRSLARQYLTSETKKVMTPLPPLMDDNIADSVLRRHESQGVSRLEMQDLFAPLSKAETMFASTPATNHSSVYPSLRLLATEVAPWVRGILRYDIMMEKERRRTGGLLSVGGKRKTRAARLAIEGGSRQRKERWFRGLGADVLRSSGDWGWHVQQHQAAEDEDKDSADLEMSNV